MSEHRSEPSIDPQPGEIGGGHVDVRGDTELVGPPNAGGGPIGWPGSRMTRLPCRRGRRRGA
jgi:hypothetical protein